MFSLLAVALINWAVSIGRLYGRRRTATLSALG